MWLRSQRRLSQRVKHYGGLRLNRNSTTSKTQATNKKIETLISLPAADAEAGASPLLLLFKPGKVSICEKPEELKARGKLQPAEMTGPTQPACHNWAERCIQERVVRRMGAAGLLRHQPRLLIPLIGYPVNRLAH